MTKTLTRDEFHAQLREEFGHYLLMVSEGKTEPYSFLGFEGSDYNAWLEHRHGWPVTEDGLCGPSSTGECGDDCCPAAEVEADECGICTMLIRMYEKEREK